MIAVLLRVRLYGQYAPLVLCGASPMCKWKTRCYGLKWFGGRFRTAFPRLELFFSFVFCMRDFCERSRAFSDA